MYQKDSRIFLSGAAVAGLLLPVLISPPALAQLTAEAAATLELKDWASGLQAVTDIAFLSDGRAVIVRKGGIIAVHGRDGEAIKAEAARMTTVDATNEKGLLGVVIDGQDNIYLYASTGNDNLNKHKIYKARAAADGTVTVDIDAPILSMGLEGPANHDGGGLIIHKGQLYIGVGDTGANATPPLNKYSSCLNKPNAKILRINLDGSVPADNPLSGEAMVTSCTSVTSAFGMAPPDKRVYAWGLRNPWRFWIDEKTDLLWIGDVGETTQEEISVGGAGVHHGYPFVEGTKVWGAVGGIADCMAMVPPRPCTAPTDSYVHTEPGAAMRTQSSVTGGLVPRERCGWGAYETKYFFGDYNRNVLWTLDLAPDRRGAVAGSRKVLATAVSTPVSFRSGPDGGIYIVSNNEGSIKRLAPKSIPATCVSAAQPPPDGGAGGAPGSGGGSGAGGRGGAAGGSRDAAGDGVSAGDDDGCGCRIGAASRGAGWPGLLALAGLSLLLTRRRRR